MSYTTDAIAWSVWDEPDDGSVTYLGEVRASGDKFIAIAPGTYASIGTYTTRSSAKQALVREYKKSL